MRPWLRVSTRLRRRYDGGRWSDEVVDNLLKSADFHVERRAQFPKKLRQL